MRHLAALRNGRFRQGNGTGRTIRHWSGGGDRGRSAGVGQPFERDVYSSPGTGSDHLRPMLGSNPLAAAHLPCSFITAAHI